MYVKINVKISLSFKARKASYLEGDSLMGIMPLHLHVNQNTDFVEEYLLSLFILGLSHGIIIISSFPSITEHNSAAMWENLTLFI